MASMIDEAEARAISARQETVAETEVSSEVSEGLRLARFCAVEEFVGLVFGVMTVVYIVMSLTSLIP
jgi:hypothetical protein